MTWPAALHLNRSLELDLILIQNTATNKLLHHALDDSLQHFPHIFIARGGNLYKLGFAVSFCPVDTVQHQTMQMNVQVSGFEVFRLRPNGLLSVFAMMSFGDLQTYLIVKRTVLAIKTLAGAKEGVYQVFMAKTAPQTGLQALPKVLDRLRTSWQKLVLPSLR
jgi:hypothetical protein